MMKKWEILLDILIEECAEVIQRVTKAKRFGLTEVQPGQYEGCELNNAERIMLEFADLLGVYSILYQEGHLPEACETAVKMKVKKVEKYLDLSRKEGRLED